MVHGHETLAPPHRRVHTRCSTCRRRGSSASGERAPARPCSTGRWSRAHSSLTHGSEPHVRPPRRRRRAGDGVAETRSSVRSSGCSCSAGESGRPSSRAFRSVAGLTGRTERSSMIGIAAWRAFGRAKLRDLRRARTRSPRTMIFAVAMTKRLAGQTKRRHRVVTLRAPAQRSHQLQDQERQARQREEREERECRGGAPAAPSTTLGGTAGLQKLRRTADDGRRDTWRSVCRWRIAARH